MQEVSQEPDFSLPWHRHADARIVLILSGTVNETELAGIHAYQKGDYVFRPPYHLHANASSSHRARFLRLPVSHMVWTQFVARNTWRSARGRINISEGDISELSRTPFAGDLLLDVAYLQSSRDESEDRREVALETLARDLRAGDSAPPRIDRRAEEMGVPAYQLTRQFVRRYGLTPSAYRRESRLQRALHMLHESSWALARISMACNYADQSHFTRDVVRATGNTPAELRRSFSAA